MQSKKTELNQDLVTQLSSVGSCLTDSVFTEITNRGDEVIPELIAILEDAELAKDDAPGDGYVPSHAAEILKRLRAIEAIEPMLRVLSQCDCLDALYSDLIRALASFGLPVLEPALKAHALATADQRRAIEDVLASLGVRDQRIFALLLQRLHEDVSLGATFLTSYGDPAALPDLSKALDACVVNARRGTLDRFEVVDLAYAIEDLGGTLTEQQAKLHDLASKPASKPPIRRQAKLPLTSLSVPLGKMFR